MQVARDWDQAFDLLLHSIESLHGNLNRLSASCHKSTDVHCFALNQYSTVRCSQTQLASLPLVQQTAKHTLLTYHETAVLYEQSSSGSECKASWLTIVVNISRSPILHTGKSKCPSQRCCMCKQPLNLYTYCETLGFIRHKMTSIAACQQYLMKLAEAAELAAAPALLHVLIQTVCMPQLQPKALLAGSAVSSMPLSVWTAPQICAASHQAVA